MTRHSNAQVTTARVNDWLQTSGSMRILHVFDHACNVVNEHREVLSIVTPGIGKGPFNLVVENSTSFTGHITSESAVYKTPIQLRIGSMIIQTHTAKLWDAHLPWNTLHIRRHAILHEVKALPRIQSQVSNLQFSNSLSSSLAIANISSSITAATMLAGLGEGLTPSGDDYLMGALHAAWIIHPQEVAQRIAQEIVNKAAPLTTTLSGAWLRAAAAGEAGILWHAFFDSLVAGEQDVIEAKMSNILSVGASSGADAMAGFINTLTAFMEIENKHVIS